MQPVCRSIAALLLALGTTWLFALSGLRAQTHGASATASTLNSEDVAHEVARARAATQPFKQVAEALAAGYMATVRCIEDPRHGAMGLHYKNPLLRDATLDVEHPEILLYHRMPDESLRLTGVEYIVPLSAWSGGDAPTVMGQTLKRDDQLGVWYLHAWIWEENPSGIFADWNPRLTC